MLIQETQLNYVGKQASGTCFGNFGLTHVLTRQFLGIGLQPRLLAHGIIIITPPMNTRFGGRSSLMGTPVLYISRICRRYMLRGKQILKIFVVYDNNGMIKSVGAPEEEVEDQEGLEAPEGCKVLELKSSDVAEIRDLDQDNAIKNNVEKRQRILATIFESYQVDTKRRVIIRRSAGS